MDMLGKGEGRRLAMSMVEVATCHGMAMSMHNGRVQGGQGVQQWASG